MATGSWPISPGRCAGISSRLLPDYLSGQIAVAAVEGRGSTDDAENFVLKMP